MKPCSKCQKPFSEDAFRKRSDRPGWMTQCRQCEIERGAEWAKANRGRRTQKMRERRNANPEKAKADRRAHYEKNKEKVLAQAAIYRIAHKEKERAARKAHYERNKEKVAQVAKEYRQKNKGKVAAWQKKYQANKLQATPPWADLIKIEQIYITCSWLSQESGEAWHVDHIVPLQGKTVCGLHCEKNLTLLPGGENMSKSNRYWPDMW